MNIVPLSKENLEETIKMVNEVFPDDINAEYNPERSFRIAIKFIEEPELLENRQMKKIGYWIVLSDEGNEVIGVTGLYRRKNDPSDLVWLGWYCIRSDQRGNGLGRKLLEWTIEKARSGGYKLQKIQTKPAPKSFMKNSALK